MYQLPRTKSDLLRTITKPVEHSRLFARSTLELIYADGSRAIRYHDTDVFTQLANGDFILDSGGFRTVTTKERINSQIGSLGLSLFQEKGFWYLSARGKWDKRIIFADGMRFSKSGKLLSKESSIDLKQVSTMKRRISAYVKLIDKLDPLPLPNNGDCFYCAMREVNTGKPLGDLSHSDHLLSHLEEGYIHGSILVNAMREKGYRDDQIGIHLHMKIRDTIKRALRVYLMKRLLPNVCSR